LCVGQNDVAIELATMARGNPDVFALHVLSLLFLPGCDALIGFGLGVFARQLRRRALKPFLLPIEPGLARPRARQLVFSCDASPSNIVAAISGRIIVSP